VIDRAIHLNNGRKCIPSYELNYQKGRVMIGLGIYSGDIISNGIFERYLDRLLPQYDIRIRD
jgi:hypothetical protein